MSTGIGSRNTTSAVVKATWTDQGFAAGGGDVLSARDPGQAYAELEFLLGRLRQGFERLARQRIRRLALLFADGDIDRLGYDEGRAEAQHDLEASASELERLGHVQAAPAVLPPLNEVLRSAGGWQDILEHGDLRLRREVLGIPIDHVVAQRVGSRKYEARIVWTPFGERRGRHAADRSLHGPDRRRPGREPVRP